MEAKQKQLAAPKRSQKDVLAALRKSITRVEVCIPKPSGKNISIKFTKNEEYFMVRSKMKVDKRIPIDLLSGFAAKLKCTVLPGGKERTIRGVNWRISWANAANLIGKENVGKSKTLTCKLVV
jgi:hypothetical protein